MIGFPLAGASIGRSSTRIGKEEMHKLFFVTIVVTALSLAGCSSYEENLLIDLLTDDGEDDGEVGESREEQGDPITVDGRTYLTINVFERRIDDRGRLSPYEEIVIDVNVRGVRVRCTDNEDCIRRVRATVQRMDEGDEM